MADKSPSKPPSGVVSRVTSLVRQSRQDKDGEFALPTVCSRLLNEYDYEARVRNSDDTLVLYPSEWVRDDGIAKLSNIDETERAIEISLSGPNYDADWDVVEEDNAATVATVREEHGDVHAANVRAFADFMGNHYLKRVTEATEEEQAEFLNDYFERNVWATEQQKAVVEESLALLENDEPR